MANYYRTVFADIWNNPTFQKMNQLQQRFYLLLLTAPESSECSVYTLTVKTISYRLSCSTKAAEQLIKDFQDANLIMYDYENEEVYVKFYFNHKPASGGLPIFMMYKKDIAKIRSAELKDFLATDVSNCADASVPLVASLVCAGYPEEMFANCGVKSIKITGLINKAEEEAKKNSKA